VLYDTIDAQVKKFSFDINLINLSKSLINTLSTIKMVTLSQCGLPSFHRIGVQGGSVLGLLSLPPILFKKSENKA
jgi:hypothetical protein|tara:strand:- start:1541 stop:1765 length:225 start_codon:yes stop_codon:yes gene_type:complete